ncbi:exodeoxyribonuclease VII large subunit [Streptococcus moroccensis]|uniref:Exodeoxyribonuclease 7 large subunit n=1 Tax=Streptococcus moroccensis TaxID=1451356 RepID=A0ABT9YU19_9STRE|nr:exodeoxyribonuclease VII large subunit [Streptococcus moroccensis]MDQ0223481.1 exodeoxyribonuclease VII large subunit [Streptococcus moroccensis]
MAEYLTVSHLTKYLKLKFDKDPYLARVYLTGQVSNFRKRPNHQYFSLKDEGAVIQATIWGGVYQKLGFELEEGMKVNVVGRVQLYEPGGSYSIVIEKAEPDGIGALAIQFEQLKKRLGDEGLFKPEWKQPLPQFSNKIGVITSPSGAVIRDIITTVSRRFPGVEILLFPTKVQGEGVAQSVVANIHKANQRDDLDVLIIGRGGGSIEDLWGFNEEIVVRAIFESRLPVISSVGHETDTTLSDFVADQRAATPTAAAELATPVTKADLVNHLRQQQNRAFNATLNRVRFHQERLRKLSQSIIFKQPERLYDGYLQKLDQLSDKLQQTMDSRFQTHQQTVRLLQERLKAQRLEQKIASHKQYLQQQTRLLKTNMANIYDNKMHRAKQLSEAMTLLDTSRIVARGYAMVYQEGRVVESSQTLKIGAPATIQMRDGQVEVEVKDVKKQKNI